MDEKGNTIILTGGSSGIGKGLATYFYNQGNKVIVIGRKEDKLHEIKSMMPDIIIKRCDLSNPEEIKELVNFCKEHHPDINILINNAGIEYNYIFSHDTPIPTSFIYEEIATNLTAPIILSNGLLPILSKNKNSAIINITSALVFVPKINASVYTATKSAVHDFTQALRSQLKGSHVKVFEVIPPLTDTPMTKENSGRKLSVDCLVDEFVCGFKKDQTTIYIQSTKLIYLLSVFFPFVLKYIMYRKYKKWKIDSVNR